MKKRRKETRRRDKRERAGRGNESEINKKGWSPEKKLRGKVRRGKKKKGEEGRRGEETTGCSWPPPSTTLPPFFIYKTSPYTLEHLTP